MPSQQNPLVRLYGIRNCDQVRAARAWLRDHGRDAEFVDLRSAGLAPETLERWLNRLPWDALLNRRGMTWRSLSPDIRATVVDQSSAAELMKLHPLLIKRPVLEYGEQLSVGFSEPLYKSLFTESV